MREEKPIHILAVDDEALSLEIIAHTLEKEGYKVTCCTNGGQALLQITSHPDEYDILLLDRKLPVMDGMEVMRRVRQQEKLRHIPVIFQTALAMQEEEVAAVNEGAFFYLSKPYDKLALLSILDAAANFVSRNREQVHKSSTTTYSTTEDQCYFEASTLEEVELIASYIAVLFPHPDDVLYGIQELMINGIEHGNLGIDNELKTILDKNGTWYDEIQTRLKMPKYKDRKVRIWFKRDTQQIQLVIRDDGEGFDWKKYLKPDAPLQKRSRGVAISSITCFDDLRYVGKGNEVRCKIYLTENAGDIAEVEQPVQKAAGAEGAGSTW